MITTSVKTRSGWRSTSRKSSTRRLRKIYDLRTKAGLSQRDLAKKVGTTASTICRLEDADYDGHSLYMLTRIADALDKRVEIRFVATKRLHPV